ncbi:NAD(P)-dependent dehydrogenase (short-subunit alcohol dehydrogenase family) [Microbacterium halimionae]|uniref:NAD(P)-dependent dehydrogenase (Short-subunit alcohol dehydrogenase family) n=1 Tax=Microbacterium halimionae TaxID=1526413 RepID=A0A7W3JQJ8_9MICO|nr:SDR family oxidoreductase [Microbacterium halimionae]MBA8817165.1 NAD(P)-dependent dehydrogenase (short-subunit alcohol dehydrogenase family) [Microbacterium halimionae]NII94615.1 NAD(P)-dependent dehydrogenase (short-subunit alcohol dehydrogenase family) [Microbacterium halimionae]
MVSGFVGLTALVTGGASGIGAAVVARLREEGARVAVFDINPEGVRADLALAVDISDDDAVRAGMLRVAEMFGGLDILVNNAGVGARGDISANDDAEWARVLDINVVGIARVTRSALPYLHASHFASVVNVASIAATAGLPQRALYSASKGAVLGLSRAMAADYVRLGIRINAVAPGTADTPWVGRLLSEADDPIVERSALESRQPHGRLVTAEEIADAVAYLAGPRASSTTGITLAVDGGMAELRLAAVQ